LTQTNLPLFRAPVVRDIRRTHSELVKLQDHLIYANSECFVPALPPAITSAGAGTEEDERRMKNDIQKWLDVISSNPVLMRDEEIMLFVQSDFGVYLF
jgi:PX domain